MVPGPIPHVLFLPDLFPAPHPSPGPQGSACTSTPWKPPAKRIQCLEPRRKESWARQEESRRGRHEGPGTTASPHFFLRCSINCLE